MDNIWLMLLLQLLLIGLNAIFACAEIAVITINENKLERLSEQGNKKARKLQNLKAEPAGFLATIQVAITLSGFLGSAFAADNFSDKLVDFLVSLGVNIPINTLDTVAVILITIILSYFTLILGELVPKRVAMQKAESLALALSNLLYFIAKIFKPIVSFLTLSTNTVLKILRIDPNQSEDDMSEEDIRMMIDAGSKSGAIDNDEKNLIHNIFEFDDMTAGEIATHRTDVRVLLLSQSDDEWDDIIKNGSHGKYPVCSESADKVVGILDTKVYFRLKSYDRDSIMKFAVKPAYFVPEGANAEVLFKNMKATHNYFAVVLDEYGGMSGIITITDLIEQLIGDIETDTDQGEYIPDIEEITDENGTFWIIKGSAFIDDIKRKVGIAFPETECDTFGGFIFSAIGVIPKDGSSLELNFDTFTVDSTEISNHHLIKARVRAK